MVDSRRIAALLGVSAMLLTIPLVLGFLGTLHPALDALSHFRLHLAALVILFGLPLIVMPGWRRIGLLAMMLGLGSITSITTPYGQAQAGAGEAEAGAARYRLLQLNLRYDNPTPKAVLSLIGRSQADVITLNEVSAMWREGVLEMTAKAYPYRLVCPPPSRVGGVAILSRRPFWPETSAQCFDRGALAIATVNIGGAAVDIAALHLGWPWPFEQHRQLDNITPAFARLAPTAILAGDLNATPWSFTAKRVSSAGGLAAVADIGPTWLARPAPNFLRRFAGLPIDNIFVKGRVVPLSTSRLESVGSDHLPVLLEFSLLPEEAPPGVMHAGIE